jgi:hypothetical protein
MTETDREGEHRTVPEVIEPSSDNPIGLLVDEPDMDVTLYYGI